MTVIILKLRHDFTNPVQSVKNTRQETITYINKTVAISKITIKLHTLHNNATYYVLESVVKILQ